MNKSTIKKLMMLDNLAKYFFFDHRWLQSSIVFGFIGRRNYKRYRIECTRTRATKQEIKLRNTFLAIARINGFSVSIIAKYLNKDYTTIRHHLASMKPHWQSLSPGHRELFVVPPSQLQDQ